MVPKGLATSKTKICVGREANDAPKTRRQKVERPRDLSRYPLLAVTVEEEFTVMSHHRRRVPYFSYFKQRCFASYLCHYQGTFISTHFASVELDKFLADRY